MALVLIKTRGLHTWLDLSGVGVEVGPHPKDATQVAEVRRFWAEKLAAPSCSLIKLSL